MKCYPCDGPEGYCPYDAEYGHDCEWYCGLGREEEPEDYYEEESEEEENDRW